MRRVPFSIGKKLFLMSAAIFFPFLIMIIYLLFSMADCNRSYERIVSSMTVANNYNLNFKEEMDESLYKLVVGYVRFDTIEQDETLRNPYELIDELRSEFTKLMDMTTEDESKIWLQSLLRNIDTLEKRVDDIRESLEIGGTYDENIEKLDNNIYILTELIQDDIQYYIYYQTRSMEKVSRNLHQQMNQMIVACTAISIVLGIVTVTIIIYILVGILKSIDSLFDATQKVSAGDLEARAKVQTNDEIAALANGFNSMADNMQLLIQEIKEDEQKMRKGDLRLLQEQINPHFLYNTLDTIVWLIESNETEQAVEMVVLLSDFFRLTLSKGKEFITIREEEQHIRSYLEIQEMRYHDILEYEIQIDPKLYEYQILKLTMQPLVENALYHGIKYKRAKGCIQILGKKVDDTIILTVHDNGVGMDEEELKQLQYNITRPCKDTETGFGLANVNERLRMYFGEQYGVSIFSAKEKGTTVEVKIPAVRCDNQMDEKSEG